MTHNVFHLQLNDPKKFAARPKPQVLLFTTRVHSPIQQSIAHCYREPLFGIGNILRPVQGWGACGHEPVDLTFIAQTILIAK